MDGSDAFPTFFHVGITVSDMDRAIAFYRDGLGLTLLSDRVATSQTLHVLTGVDVTSMRIALLDGPGGGTVELLEYDPGRQQVSDGRRPASTPGTGHACFFVEDLDVAQQRLVETGGTVVSSSPVTVSAGEFAGRQCVYMRDPDGYLLELFTPGAAAT